MRRIALVLACLWPTTALADDPDAIGPYEVERNEYGLGTTAFVPDSLPVAATEVLAVVHNPVDIAAGPFPLVVMLHGRHPSCVDPDAFDPDFPWDNTSYGWPCSAGSEPIPSYIGYDYWAANLASHGYVVVSISANGLVGFDNTVFDAGATARAELIAHHLGLWQAFNDTDEYGTHYNGAVDLQNIGMVGHSRGGEGVARFTTYAAEQGLPYHVEAIIELTPIDVLRTPLPNIAVAAILPYCDGDVFYLDGAHYYDDSRLAADGDTHPKYSFVMAGSNHNFYNTTWSPTTFPNGGGLDDWADLIGFAGIGDDAHCGFGSGSGRLDEAQQQATMVAFGNAFFRAHLGHETEFLPFLRGDEPGPASAAPAEVRTGYMPPDTAGDRLLVNQIAGLDSLVTNDLGAAVTGENLATYDVCGIDPAGGDNYVHCVAMAGMLDGQLFEGREPHAPGLAHLRLGFTGEARWINELGGPTDVSELSFLQFRASVDFEDPAYAAGPVDFSVRLVDAAGVEATTTVGEWTDTLAEPPGELYPILPRLLLGNVRIPITAFTTAAPDFDPTGVVRIELVFDHGAGAILLSDLVFADAVPPPEPGTTGGSGGSSSGTTAAVDDTADGTADSDTPTTSTGPASGSSGSTSGPSESGGDGGCGCRSHGHDAAGWLVVIVGLARRRRARRAHGGAP